MKKSDVAARFQLRRGLGQSEAALYIGIGTTKFAEMVENKTMPRPHLIGTRRIWDIDDLDAAFRDLPLEGGDGPKKNTWADFREGNQKNNSGGRKV